MEIISLHMQAAAWQSSGEFKRWGHIMQGITSPWSPLIKACCYLQQYDLDIHSQKRVLNNAAHALSPDPLTNFEHIEPEPILSLENTESCSWYQANNTAIESNPAALTDYCIRDNRIYTGSICTFGFYCPYMSNLGTYLLRTVPVSFVVFFACEMWK